MEFLFCFVLIVLFCFGVCDCDVSETIHTMRTTKSGLGRRAPGLLDRRGPRAAGRWAFEPSGRREPRAAGLLLAKPIPRGHLFLSRNQWQHCQ